MYSETIRQLHQQAKAESGQKLTRFIELLAQWIRARLPRTRRLDEEQFAKQMRRLHSEAVNQGTGEVNYRKRVEQLVSKTLREAPRIEDQSNNSQRSLL